MRKQHNVKESRKKKNESSSSSSSEEEKAPRASPVKESKKATQIMESIEIEEQESTEISESSDHEVKKKKVEKQKKRKRESTSSEEDEPDVNQRNETEDESSENPPAKKPKKSKRKAAPENAATNKTKANKRAKKSDDNEEDFDLEDHEELDAEAYTSFRIADDDQGEKVKLGKFTTEEDELIIAAVQNYMADNDLDYNEDLQALLDGKIKGHQRPWRKIASEVPGRRLPAVRNHARRLLCQRHRGPWTKQETERLVELHELYETDLHDTNAKIQQIRYPSQWVKIAEQLDRTPEDVRDKARISVLVERNTGRWSAEEEQLFFKLIKKNCGGVLPTEDGAKIPWTKIAERLGTRTMNQCIIKWRESRPDRAGGSLYTGPAKFWTAEDDKILVLKLSLLRATDNKEIVMTNISKSWMRTEVQSRWTALKRSVPNSANMPFPDLLKSLRASLRLNKEERDRLTAQHRLEDW